MKGLALLVLLAACPPPRSAAHDGFAIHYYSGAVPDEIRAQKGLALQLVPTTTCTTADGATGRWTMTSARVTTGQLPPGVIVEDGELKGVPTTVGTYKATIRFGGVTCASVPVDDKLVHVTIVVAAAPAAP